MVGFGQSLDKLVNARSLAAAGKCPLARKSVYVTCHHYGTLDKGGCPLVAQK
jgi:hypothetical protein